ADLTKVALNVNRMKRNAILIATIALLLGTDAGLIKPAPEAGSPLTKPAPGGGDALIRPAPGTDIDLTKPAPGSETEIKPLPGTDGDLIQPLPGTGGELIKPLPGTGGELIKPLPGTGGELIKPLPGTGGELIKPLPGTGGELIKPLPGTGGELIKPLPGTGGELIKPLPGTGGELIKPLPGTGGELIKPLPGTGGELIKPLPGTGGELIKPLPGTGGELIKPLPGTGGELIKPLPGTGGELIKPLPGTGGELIKPLPGTGSELTKPAPGNEGSLTKPAPGTGDQSSETRKVLPHLVLSYELENALLSAQFSISSTVKKEAKLIQKVPEQSELVLEDLHIAIDDDISVQLSNLKLLNAPSIDVISANPNLEFLNLGVDIDFGTLQVGGNFEIVSKNALAEIPVTSSGEFILKNSGVKATGKVGLSLQTNFFKTINYDVVYQPSESYLTVSYLEDNKRVVSALEVQEHQEAKVVAHINRELKNVLNRLVQKRLDNILGAVPVDKLIGETRLTESYRKHARALRTVANDYIDEVLSFAQSFIVDNELSEIAAPDIEASFSQEILFITWQGRFGTSDGHASNLATVIRTGDISLDYDSNTGGIKVFGSLGLRQLDIAYNRYEVQFQGLGPSGTVSAHVGSNSAFIKVDLVLSIAPTIILEDFHIEYA
ncbi:hypothetical protein Cfor_02543, partial [Coptotermes formosanus]